MSGTISSGSGLKLDNERDHVFVQPLSRDTCIAWHACSADRAYIALNHLRSAAQNPKHPDSEGLASTLVQTLEPASNAKRHLDCVIDLATLSFWPWWSGVVLETR